MEQTMNIANSCHQCIPTCDGQEHVTNEIVKDDIGVATEERHIVPGDMPDAICAMFLNERICMSWILRRLHQKEPECPGCKMNLPQKYHERFWSNDRVKCPFCGKWFTAITNTIFHGSHMCFREIALLMLFLGLNQPAKYIAKVLDIDAETVRAWRRKFNRNTKTGEK